jgi:hypothetical protein
LSMHLSLHHLQEAEAVRPSVYASQSQCLQKRGWSHWVSEHPQLSTISSSLSSRVRSSLIEEASAVATALLNRRRSRLIKPLSCQLRKHNISCIVSPLRHLRLGLRVLPAILNTRSGSSLIAGMLYISRAICAN